MSDNDLLVSSFLVLVNIRLVDYFSNMFNLKKKCDMDKFESYFRVVNYYVEDIIIPCYDKNVDTIDFSIPNKIGGEALRFLVTMMQDENFDLSLFNHNISSLCVKFKNVKASFGGYYIAKDNKMTIIDNKSITHELLHVATSYYDFVRKNSYCGLSFNNFCMGVNEGYTCLVDCSKFNIDIATYSRIYRLLCSYSLLLSKIIGNDKMMRFYSTVDLLGFIHELSLYEYEDKVMDIMSRMDTVLRFNYDMKLFKKYKNEAINFIKKIYDDIISIYLGKGNLRDEDFNIMLREVNRNIFSGISNDEINERIYGKKLQRSIYY